MTFGRRLSKLRLAKHKSQKEVAQTMGTSQQNYAKFEKAKEAPKINTCRRIAEAIGCELTDLLTYKDEEDMYERFEKLMKERGLRLADISKHTEISYSTLTDWKVGRYTPKTDKLHKIAECLNVDLSYIMSGYKVQPADGVSSEEGSISELSPKEVMLVSEFRKLNKVVGNNMLNFIRFLADDGLSDLEKRMLSIFQKLDETDQHEIIGIAELKNSRSKK